MGVHEMYFSLSQDTGSREAWGTGPAEGEDPLRVALVVCPVKR